MKIHHDPSSMHFEITESILFYRYIIKRFHKWAVTESTLVSSKFPTNKFTLSVSYWVFCVCVHVCHSLALSIIFIYGKCISHPLFASRFVLLSRHANILAWAKHTNSPIFILAKLLPLASVLPHPLHLPLISACSAWCWVLCFVLGCMCMIMYTLSLQRNSNGIRKWILWFEMRQNEPFPWHSAKCLECDHIIIFFSFGVCIVNANANANANICTNPLTIHWNEKIYFISSFKNDAIWVEKKKKCAEFNPCSLELPPNTEKENKTNELNCMRWKRKTREIYTKLESHSTWNGRRGVFKKVCPLLISQCVVY